MPTINVTARTATSDDVEFVHSGECLSDQRKRDVCEGIYLNRLNDNLQLCAALRSVYSVAG